MKDVRIITLSECDEICLVEKWRCSNHRFMETKTTSIYDPSNIPIFLCEIPRYDFVYYTNLNYPRNIEWSSYIKISKVEELGLEIMKTKDHITIYCITSHCNNLIIFDELSNQTYW